MTFRLRRRDDRFHLKVVNDDTQSRICSRKDGSQAGKVPVPVSAWESDSSQESIETSTIPQQRIVAVGDHFDFGPVTIRKNSMERRALIRPRLGG
jgi:hypothetical protein